MKTKSLTVLLVMIYILVEIAFRSEMISFVSSVMHYGEVFFIEFSGRFIASFGFSLLVYQTISKRWSVRSRAVVVLISFLSFFVAEKAAINWIVSSLSPEDKVKAILLSNYKESVILNIKKDNFVSSAPTDDIRLTRTAFIPVSNINNEKLISSLKNKASNDVFMVFSEKGRIFNSINTKSYKRVLADIEKTYYEIIEVRNVVSGFWSKNGDKIRKLFPYAVKNVTERYNLDKNGYLGFKYPTMSKFLNSDEAREIVIGHASIATFFGYAPLPDGLVRCLTKKPWAANNFNAMVAYSKECASDAVKEKIGGELAKNGINTNPLKLDIFKSDFSSIFSQPYFVDVLGYLAPFLINPNGGVYDLVNFKNEASVLKISKGISYYQTKEVLSIINNPALVESNIKYKVISDNYSKSLIIPPFMILVSTAMIILNIIKLFLGVSSDVYVSKSRYVITFIIIFWVLLIPVTFKGVSDNRMTGETDRVMYARLWSENTSESMFLIKHEKQPFRAVLDGLVLLNIVVQKYEIPLLSSGAIDDYGYRFVADNHARRIGVIK